LKKHATLPNFIDGHLYLSLTEFSLVSQKKFLLIIRLIVRSGVIESESRYDQNLLAAKAIFVRRGRGADSHHHREHENDRHYAG
jgi:hypothetical protein